MFHVGQGKKDSLKNYISLLSKVKQKLKFQFILLDSSSLEI